MSKHHDLESIETIIRAEKVCKYYNKALILSDVTLSIKKGEIIAIIGPSGSGKSTFIRTLNLLVIPDSGTVWMGSKSSHGLNDFDLWRRQVGMVFQDFQLFPHLSVIENITLAPVVLNRISKQQAKVLGLELLAKVGLVDRALSYPYQLSGGQQQRVAIARALAMRPGILLFDEPTSSLDPVMTAEVLTVIRQLVASGITMVIVTHEMAFLRSLAHRILFFDQGKIIEESSGENFFSNSKNKFIQKFIKN